MRGAEMTCHCRPSRGRWPGHPSVALFANGRIEKGFWDASKRRSRLSVSCSEMSWPVAMVAAANLDEGGWAEVRGYPIRQKDLHLV